MMVYICTKFHENIMNGIELWSGHEKFTDGQTDVRAHELRVNWLSSVRIRWPQSHCALFRQKKKSLRHHVSLKKGVFSDCHLKKKIT